MLTLSFKTVGLQLAPLYYFHTVNGKGEHAVCS